MDILHAIILGIVEGITEFLPISSTGHLILTSHLLRIPQTDFFKSFEIVIQLGAILAVVVLYRRTLFYDRAALGRIIAAFIPTAVVGLVLYKTVKHYFLGNEALVLWALFLGGIFLIIFERFHRERENAVSTIGAMPYRTAIFLGLFQSFAMIPGVSRSGATIIGGLLLNLTRTTIVEFSFILAVPTMLAATGYDILRSYTLFSLNDIWIFAAGFLTSFMVAGITITFLMRFITHHTFIGFGVYRIILALFFWWVVL